MSCAKIGAVVACAVGVMLALARAYLVKEIREWDHGDLEGKTFLVTGCTSGIGLETVRALHGWNATVIMANRNLAKSKAVAPGNDGGSRIEHGELDLANFASVRRFAESLEGRKIDAAILNAATTADGAVTSDGVDLQYQVNHLSHFLLSNLLVPFMAEDGRIVFVSSSMHYFGIVDKIAYSATAKNADPATRRDSMSLYSDTKLFNTMTAITLSERLRQQGSSVSAMSLHPGFVKSALDEDGTALVAALMPWVRSIFARGTPAGALTQLRVATDPLLAGAGGAYFEDACINTLCGGVGGQAPHDLALDPKLRAWLWDTSAEIVKL